MPKYVFSTKKEIERCIERREGHESCPFSGYDGEYDTAWCQCPGRPEDFRDHGLTPTNVAFGTEEWEYDEVYLKPTWCPLRKAKI